MKKVPVNNLIVQFLIRHYSFDVTPKNYKQLPKPDQKRATVQIDEHDELLIKINAQLNGTGAELIKNEIYAALMYIRERLYPEIIYLHHDKKGEITAIMDKIETLKRLTQQENKKNTITINKRHQRLTDVQLLQNTIAYAIQKGKEEEQEQAKERINIDNNAYILGEIMADGEVKTKEPVLQPYIEPLIGLNGTYPIDLSKPFTLLPRLTDTQVEQQMIRSVQWRLRALLKYKYIIKSGKLSLKKERNLTDFVKADDKDVYPAIMELSKLVFKHKNKDFHYKGEQPNNMLKKINDLRKKYGGDFVPGDIEMLLK